MAREQARHHVHPPVLSKSGFNLSGGRLLPGADGPTAQFMYRGPSGERVTLCISRRQVNSNTTAFKLYQDGPVNVFYWIDGDLWVCGIRRDRPQATAATRA
jgi:anti-sigma factor RsiW